MGLNKGSEGQGTSKTIKTVDEQNAERRAAKARRKGSSTKVEHVIPTNDRPGRLDAPGAIAARRKAAYEKAAAIEAKAAAKALWEAGKKEAIRKQRVRDIERKTALLDTLTEDIAHVEKALLAMAQNNSRRSVVEAQLKRLTSKSDRLNDEIEALEAEVLTLV